MLGADRLEAVEPSFVAHIGRSRQDVEVIRVDGAIHGFLERLVVYPGANNWVEDPQVASMKPDTRELQIHKQRLIPVTQTPQDPSPLVLWFAA